MKKFNQIKMGFTTFVLVAMLCACSPEVDPAPKQLPLSDEDVALNNRGVALMGYFDYAAARDVFREAVDRRPDWVDAKINLAIATLNRQMDNDETLALQYLEEVLAQEPSNLRAHFVAGLLKERAGESEQAIAHYQTVFDHDPKDAYAAYNLAVLVQNHDAPRALALFQKAIDLDPYLRSAYYARFLLLVRSGDREEGIRLKEQYERLADNPRAKLVETKYTRMGRKAEALAVNLPQGRPFTLPAGELFAQPHEIATFAGKDTYALTTVDIQGDGQQDIFVSSASGAHQLIVAADEEYQQLKTHTLLGAGAAQAVAWGDVDNDGNTDVVMCGARKTGLWYQVSSGNWTYSPALQKFNAGRTCQDIMLLDADHDGDLDVLVAFDQGGHDIFSNNGNQTFRSLVKQSNLHTSSQTGVGLAVTDLDNDRDADIIILNAGARKNDVLINNRLWNYQAAQGMNAFENAELLAVTPADLDADGEIELYAAHANGSLQKWQRVNQQWQSTEIAKVNTRSKVEIAVVDINGDGNLDMMLVDGTGIRLFDFSTSQPTVIFSYSGTVRSAIPVVASVDLGPSLFALVKTNAGDKLMHWPPGKARGAFISLSLSGKENKAESMRSNRSGIGTQIAVRRGSDWTVTDTFDHHSGPGQSLQPLTVGLGGHSKIDYIAIDWSDGVFQTELDLQPGAVLKVTETQRQLSSCPVVFAWNGSAWEFVSDVLGVGGIGFFHAPGDYAVPRPWEYFLLPRNSVAPVNGQLQIKITEPMEELALLDEVQLTAYDLAPGWQMVMDERMGTGAPEVTGQPLFFQDEIFAKKAVRDDGLDLTAAVRHTDKRAANLGAAHDRFIGRLQQRRSFIVQFDHALDARSGTPVLVADAWVEYPYSQTVFAAWQADEHYIPPSLEAAGSDGRWQMVYPQFGYPAGMPRTMALPLDRLPAGTTQLRISSNLEIYWDRISIAWAVDPQNHVAIHNLSLLDSSLEQSGFPKRTNGAQKRPQYDYQQRTPFWDSRYPAGYYTQRGDVTPLLTKRDGAYAIIGPGEEVQVNFAVAASPPAAWQRHYVLFTAGYAKDMDMYTRDSGTVGPLPVTPGADTALHEQYNTRYQDGY